MTSDPARVGSSAAGGRRAVVLAVALLALAVAFVAGGQLLRPGTPSDTSAEAGFARDMQTHHNQAVEMALVVREKSTEPVLRSVAYDHRDEPEPAVGADVRLAAPVGAEPDLVGAGHDLDGRRAG
ncbi:DUF305 domain-containing protein [Dermatophilaceae bacterium Soc4.6]